MSLKEEENVDDIDEELIYTQMFDVIKDELKVELGSEEETPNMDLLNLTHEEIIQIRIGGLESFKNIIQSRFRQNSSSNEKAGSQYNRDNDAEEEYDGDDYGSSEYYESQDGRRSSEFANEDINGKQIMRNMSGQDSLQSSKSRKGNKMNISQKNSRRQSEQSKRESSMRSEVFAQYRSNKDLAEQPLLVSLNLETNPQQSQQSEQNTDTTQQAEKLDKQQNISNIAVEIPVSVSFEAAEQLKGKNDNQTSKPATEIDNFRGKLDELRSNQNKKVKQIISDIYSLSGVKVQHFKSLTPMGFSSVNERGSPAKTKASMLIMNKYASANSNHGNLENSGRSLNSHEDTISRIYQRHNMILEKINRLQQEKSKKELSFLSQRTPISLGSQRILQKSNYLKPSECAIENQKLKQEKIKQLLEDKLKRDAEQEMSTCTFQPQICKLNSDEVIRTQDEFVEDQNSWLLKKTKLLSSQQKQHQEFEMNDITFRPAINKTSRNQTRNIPVEEKLIQDFEKVIEKRKRLAEEVQPLFRPVLLPKSKQLAQKRRDKQFASTYGDSQQLS